MNTEFWNMGGYAMYVWGSYAAGLAVFVWNLLMPRLERRGLLRKLKDEPGIGGHPVDVRPGERPRSDARAGVEDQQ